MADGKQTAKCRCAAASRAKAAKPAAGRLLRDPHARIARFFLKKHPENIMDAERINQIGSQIADLTARTAELRGYL